MQNLSADINNDIESIVYTYGDMLYRLCYIILQNKSDAEDIVGETIIKYIEKKPQFKNDKHAKAWLITVAKNKCRDLLRYRQRHLHSDIDDIKETYSAKEETCDSGVFEALTALPEKFRLVLTLYYIDEFKTQEIAKITGKTQSAVKMRLQKGRKLLKEKYLGGGTQ